MVVDETPNRNVGVSADAPCLRVAPQGTLIKLF
jgi:hypothetical protein